MPKTPETIRVYPSPDLPPTDYLPGIGADGVDLPPDVAQDLIDRGLVVTQRPYLVGDQGPEVFIPAPPVQGGDSTPGGQ